MKEEYNNQIKQRIFEVTTFLYTYKIILGQWIYKVKKRANKSIEKFKIKWVIKGYM